MSIETRITSEQGKDAVYQAHLSKSAIEKIAGMNSSASEIDGSVNKYRQTAVLLGDSITNGNYYVDASGYLYNKTIGYFTWLQCLSGHAFNVVNFAGISGQTSTQILARVEADVIAYNPEYCFLLCGMNDPATSSDDLILQSNINEIYSKLSGNGIFLILLTNTPTSSDAGKNAQIIKTNEWMKTYFSNQPNVLVVDICSAVINSTSTTGALKTDVTRDGVHPSNNGAYLMGKKIYDSISSLIYKDYKYKPISAYDSYEFNSKSKNYFKYPLFTGANADGWHDSSKSYNKSYSNATATASIETATDGIGNAQVINITATAAPSSPEGGNLVVDFNAQMTQKFQIGDSIYATCEIEISSGAVNFANVSLSLNMNYTNVISFDNKNIEIPYHAITVPSTGLKLTLRTPIAVCPIGGVATYSRLAFLFSGAGSATFKVTKMAIVKVN